MLDNAQTAMLFLRNSYFFRISVEGVAKGLCLLLLFVLAAGNAYWYWLNSLIPSLILSSIIWCVGTMDGSRRYVLSHRALWVSFCLAAFATIGSASVYVNAITEDGYLLWLGSYVSPLVIFLAIQSVKFDSQFAWRCCAVIAAGAMFPLVHGLIRYYMEWGIPTGAELLLSRYSLVRMSAYMKATFGNTGNTAAYLALLLPMWVGMVYVAKAGPRFKAVAVYVVLIVGLLNALIVQSRTLFIVLLVAIPCVLAFFQRRLAGFFVGVLLLAGAFTLPFLGAMDELFDLAMSAVDGGSSDQSVSERVEAMQFGIRSLEYNWPFGVGPGNTITQNPYTSSHQFWVQQGSELGIGGALAAVLFSVVVVWQCVSLLARRTNATTATTYCFVFAIGPAAYIVYGCIANMALSQNVVNSWIGLCAAMLSISCRMWLLDSTAVPKGEKEYAR